VGTAVLLALKDHGGQHGHLAFDLEEQVGLVPCAVEVERGDRATASFTLPRLPRRVEEAEGVAPLAAALGLTARDIVLAGHQPSVFSAGNGFTFVPVRDRATLAKAWPVPARWSAVGPKDHPNAFVYTRDVSDPAHHYRARMFAPDMSIAEDPATGSAVAAFAGVVMAYDKPADGLHRLVVEQGYEMGRPSQITLHLTVEGGELVSAAIGGQAIVVSEGVLYL
jgi:trans-2,3-dihydro-3-hydroxyanthranilate isomerase